jgi:hypothetical protein
MNGEAGKKRLMGQARFARLAPRAVRACRPAGYIGLLRSVAQKYLVNAKAAVARNQKGALHALRSSHVYDMQHKLQEGALRSLKNQAAADACHW